MNKYVYLVFYQTADNPFVNEPIEYTCSCQITHQCNYHEMKNWVERQLKSQSIIITGYALLRVEK